MTCYMPTDSCAYTGYDMLMHTNAHGYYLGVIFPGEVVCAFIKTNRCRYVPFR